MLVLHESDQTPVSRRYLPQHANTASVSILPVRPDESAAFTRGSRESSLSRGVGCSVGMDLRPVHEALSNFVPGLLDDAKGIHFSGRVFPDAALSRGSKHCSTGLRRAVSICSANLIGANKEV